MPLIGEVNPDFQFYFPTIICQSGTLTSATINARYRKIGSLVFMNSTLFIANAGSGAGYIGVSLPFPAGGVGDQNGSGHSTDGTNLKALIVATIPYGLGLWKYDGTTAIASVLTYRFSITYETSTP